MVVRKIKVTDAESLLALFHRLDNETSFMLMEPGERKTSIEHQMESLTSYSECESKVMFVIADDGDIHGFISGVGYTSNRNNHSMYCVMGIKQALAGQGYGKRLLASLEAWAFGQAFTRLELTVMCHNERAYNLYLSTGFEVEGVKRRSLKVDGQYVDEFYMAKLLACEDKD